MRVLTSCRDAKFLLFDHDGTLVDTDRFYQSNAPASEILNPETVAVIAKTNLPFAIVAGTYRKHVERTVKVLPRAPLFCICLEDSYPKTKPDPEPYLIALKKIEEKGMKVRDVVVFEDSEIGEASAKEAGFRVVRVKSFVK